MSLLDPEQRNESRNYNADSVLPLHAGESATSVSNPVGPPPLTKKTSTSSAAAGSHSSRYNNIAKRNVQMKELNTQNK